jgi:hypothetical protein
MLGISVQCDLLRQHGQSVDRGVKSLWLFRKGINARFNQYHFLSQWSCALEQSLDTFNPFVTRSIRVLPTKFEIRKKGLQEIVALFFRAKFACTLYFPESMFFVWRQIFLTDSI